MDIAIPCDCCGELFPLTWTVDERGRQHGADVYPDDPRAAGPGAYCHDCYVDACTHGVTPHPYLAAAREAQR